MNRSNHSFPFFTFKGTHRQIGQQYGEACAELIKKNLELSLERLTSRVNIGSKEDLDQVVMQNRQHVEKHASFFDEQIQGVAEGSGISLADAYFIQWRAEAYNYFKDKGLPENNEQRECTSYAVLPEATSDGIALVGKNADLPEYCTEIGLVMECRPNHAPAYLMVTLAGLVSYEGINDQGMGVAANFLDCDGWRTGVPRYMFPGMALTRNSVEDAVQSVRNMYRASSRNIMILDSKGKGNAVGMEVTPTSDALYQPKNGLLAHSNHFVSEELRGEERVTGRLLENSHNRLNRMSHLLQKNYGDINVHVMQDILRDREGGRDCICVNPGDEEDWITFSSIICAPSKGEMWITAGPPNQNEYKRYTFTS